MLDVEIFLNPDYLPYSGENLYLTCMSDGNSHKTLHFGATGSHTYPGISFLKAELEGSWYAQAGRKFLISLLHQNTLG